MVIRKCVTTSIGKAWGKLWTSWKKNQGYFNALEMLLHNLFFSPHSTRILKDCRIREMFSNMPFMYGVVAGLVGAALSLASVVVVGRWVFRRIKSSLKLFFEKKHGQGTCSWRISCLSCFILVILIIIIIIIMIYSQHIHIKRCEGPTKVLFIKI